MRLSRAISFGRCRVRRRSTAVGERGFASGLSPGRGATLRQPLRCAGNGAPVRLPLPGAALRRLQALSLKSYRALRALPLSRERIAAGLNRRLFRPPLSPAVAA